MKCLVILCNIGGPDSDNKVFFYLLRFFLDKRIIPLNFLARFFLAFFIALFRSKKSFAKYNKIGGSPLKKNSKKQALAIEEELKAILSAEIKVDVCMRYSKSSEKEMIKLINEFEPNKILILPLFPQFSSATTASAFDQWKKIEQKVKNSEIQKICCFYNDKGIISFYANKIKEEIKNFGNNENIKVLFSAHSLPQYLIDNGDPYKNHVEIMAKSIAQSANIENWAICYQSKVGRKKWLLPSTEEAIEFASKDNNGLIVVPISFVSENLETLYDLDIEIKKFAKNCGIEFFSRIETPGDDSVFIKSISQKILLAIQGKEKIFGCGKRCSIKCGLLL